MPVQPALLTRMSTRPNVSFAASTMARPARRSATSVGTISALRPSASISACTALDFVVPPVRVLGEHQVRAGLREPERDGAADALRRAGHDRDLVLQAEARVVNVHSCSIVDSLAVGARIRSAENRGFDNSASRHYRFRHKRREA